MSTSAPIYVPGRYYSVPCVRGEWLGAVDEWVVLGPPHNDAAYIGFDIEHWHLHPQFAPDHAVQRRRGQEAKVFTFPICTRDAEFIGLRRRRCRRPMPPYPRGVPHWTSRLESAYADATLNARRICPHQGADLSRVPVRHGCITCPLHGLTFEADTGRLQRTPEP